jgi:hypothetical protein
VVLTLIGWGMVLNGTVRLAAPGLALRFYLGAYDVKARRMLSLRLLFEGTYRGPPPYDKAARETGAVVEWSCSKIKN